MIYPLHLILATAYILVPLGMFTRALLAKRHHRPVPMRRFWLTAFGGLVMASLICSTFAMTSASRPIPSQVILCAYFATAVLFLLKGFDRLLWKFAGWIMQLGRGRRRWSGLRASIGLGLRAVVLFGIGLPYILAVTLTYRPRVISEQNPQTLYKWTFEPVKFSTSDNVRIAGWWIPAKVDTGRTVVLCHGQDDSMASQLYLARDEVRAGYNLLVIDFRAHGQSGGQLTSFGDLERNDVLGAIRWLRTNHPQACRKVVGIGVGTGGSALIAAAVDPGPDGQNIDAVAVYGCFDDLDNVADDLVYRYLPAPMNFLTLHVGLPLASVHAGTNLGAFSPADLVKSLWPRPILVIHGLNDETIPFERGEALYDAALQPKQSIWIERAGHNESLENKDTARAVRRFFDNAARVL